MNENIREVVKKKMRLEGISQTELAEKIGVKPQEISRALAERGKVPPIWQKILDALDLDLTATPKE